MGVLKVDKEVFNNYEDTRMDGLCGDVREIIDKRISIAELTDFQYSHTTGRDRIKKAIRIVLRRYADEIGVWPVSDLSIFDISIRKDKQGRFHYYVMFDPEKWDEEVEESIRRKKEHDAE